MIKSEQSDFFLSYFLLALIFSQKKGSTLFVTRLDTTGQNLIQFKKIIKQLQIKFIYFDFSNVHTMGYVFWTCPTS